MKIAIVGLGRMGANMARRLSRGGHSVVGYNRTARVTKELVDEAGIIPAYSLNELANLLEPPRVAWLMIPAGPTTEDVLLQLTQILSPGDILVDGGAYFQDTLRRASMLTERGFHFLDAGVSGGIWGLKEGFSLMIGGEETIVEQLTPIFQTLAPGPDRGWGRVGPHGAGHYVKMVHNGIEYGMMEALAEGFDIMRSSKDFDFDLFQISKIWQHGSVVRSWLLDLLSAAVEEDQDLRDLKGWVADSGEGRWTVFEAINNDVPAPVITLSLLRRFESRQEERYAAKLLAAMRNQFGGHEVRKSEGQEVP
jgi:6-phosphogluconate dehydrogenase